MEEIIITSLSEIVANADNPRIEDYKEALLCLEYLFRGSSNTPFNLFGEFNDSEDLLFNVSCTYIKWERIIFFFVFWHFGEF